MAVLSPAGFLTHHPFRIAQAFSPANSRAMAIYWKERRKRSFKIAGGTQRPDRPGVTFPQRREIKTRAVYEKMHRSSLFPVDAS